MRVGPSPSPVRRGAGKRSSRGTTPSDSDRSPDDTSARSRRRPPWSWARRVALPLGHPGPVGGLVDLLGLEVGRGVHEGLGHGRAVPGPLDEDEAVVLPLDAEVVLGVVEDGPVAEGPGGQGEVLGLGVGVGAVPASQLAGWPWSLMLCRARTALSPGSFPGGCKGAMPTTRSGNTAGAPGSSGPATTSVASYAHIDLVVAPSKSSFVAPCCLRTYMPASGSAENTSMPSLALHFFFPYRGREGRG